MESNSLGNCAFGRKSFVILREMFHMDISGVFFICRKKNLKEMLTIFLVNFAFFLPCVSSRHKFSKETVIKNSSERFVFIICYDFLQHRKAKFGFQEFLY